MNDIPHNDGQNGVPNDSHAGDPPPANASHAAGPPTHADGPILAQLSAIEGLVKWFDPRKGFGFIVGPEGQDIFAHYTVIEGDGFRVLKDGSNVVYDAVKTEKGWKATKVRRTDPIEVTVMPRRSYSRTPRR